jgi:hypothetical protein
MEILCDTPKVWLVYREDSLSGLAGELILMKVFTTEAAAQAYVSSVLEPARKYYSIEWEKLHD